MSKLGTAWVMKHFDMRLCVLITVVLIALCQASFAEKNPAARKSNDNTCANPQSITALRTQCIDLLREKKFSEARSLVKSAYDKAKSLEGYSSNPFEAFPFMGIYADYCKREFDSNPKTIYGITELQKEEANLLKLKIKLPTTLSKQGQIDAWLGLSRLRWDTIRACSELKKPEIVVEFNKQLESLPWYATLRDQVGQRTSTLLAEKGNATIVLPATWMSLYDLKDGEEILRRTVKINPGPKGLDLAKRARVPLSTLTSVEQDGLLSFICLELDSEASATIDSFGQLKGKGVLDTPVDRLPKSCRKLTNEYAVIDGCAGCFTYMGGTDKTDNFIFNSRKGNKQVLLTYTTQCDNAPALFAKIKSNFMNAKFNIDK